MTGSLADAIIRNAPFGIAIIDSDLRYLAINKLLARIDGIDDQNVVGEKVFDVLPHLEAKLLPIYRAVLDEGKEFSDLFVECELPIGSGKILRFSSNYYPIVSPDGERYIGVMVRDVTTELKLAEERDALLSAAQDARNEAERANRIKDDFLASLSHELRTPLNAVLGWAQLLRRKTVGPDVHEQGLEIIERNAHAQAELISDLLDMSRIISGKLTVEKEELDIYDVVSNVFDSFVPLFAAKGIITEQHVHPVRGAILGDRSRLQQVFANLLSNSLKFTPSGGTIKIHLNAVKGSVEIVVSDTGIGIDPGFAPQIFNRFSQEESALTRKAGGLGIGLSIVRHIVELHGGTVSVHSEGRGKGASFTVRLPVSTQARSVTPANEVASPSSEKRFDGLNVLVVENDASSQALFNCILSDQGARVESVDSAESALEILNDKRFDLLISDIGLPGEDGYSLIRQVRKLANPNKKVAAVAVTAFARPEDSDRALQAGFQVHLAKPVAPEEMISTVHRLASSRLF